MSNKLKCPTCGKGCKKTSQKIRSGRINPVTGEEIIVNNALTYKCNSRSCATEWMPAHEEERITAIINRQATEHLQPTQIQRLREGISVVLGATTKTKVATFLRLNAKAFTRWESGGDEISDAYDLLLRLVARSKDNVEFVKALHKKKFKFEESDYLIFRTEVNNIDSSVMQNEQTVVVNYASEQHVQNESYDFAKDTYPPLGALPQQNVREIAYA